MKKYVFESLKFFCAAILCTILSAFASPSWGALPDGYTELQYIESTGEQYIDTGVKGTQNSKFDIDFERTGTAFTPFGSRRSATVSSFAIWSTTDRTDGSLRIGFDDTPGYTGVLVEDMPARLHIVHSKSGTYVNDNLVATPTDYSNFTTPTNLMVFARTDTSLGLMTTPMKLYSLKLYTSDTLVRDFVPAKNSSGVVGMYDTVTRTFFANAGTGEFIAGPAIGNLVDVSSAYASYGTYVQNNDTFVYTPDASTNDQKGLAFRAPVTDGHKIFISCNYSIEGSDSYRVGLAKNSSLGYFSSAADVITTGTNKTFSGIVTAVADRSGFLGFRTDATSGSLSVKNIQVYDLTAIFGEGNEPDAAGAYAYFNSIKIATTKYNESAFGPLNTALANAISVVDTVVSNTITQAGRIATLQTQKQTRPANDTCPAYKQCLLVEDEQGTPHWYEITDPFRDFVAPIIANNVAPASTTNDAGYTQLEYIDVQQYAKIELPHQNLTNNFDVEFQVQWPENPTTYEPLLVTMKNDNAWFGGYNSNRMALRGYSGTDYVLISKPESGRVVTINFRANNNSTSIYYNGVLQGTGPASTLISTPDVKTFMFSDNVAASSGNNFTGRFYYMKINGNLYVPVKRNSDGAIGVYDTVSKMFFGNKGSGTFTAGPNVANTDVPANGTWTATWAANATTGVAAGTVYGEALCNGVAGTDLSIVTQEQISSSGWSNNGANCWCRVTSVSNNDGGYSVTNSNWVYYSSSAACTSGCAGYCDYGIRAYPAFRQNLFSM